MKQIYFILPMIILFCSCGFFQRTELVNHSAENIQVDLYLSSFKNSQFGIRTDSVCLDDSIKIVFQQTGAHSVVGHLKSTVEKEVSKTNCKHIKQHVNTYKLKKTLGIPLTIVTLDAHNEQLILQANLAPNDRLDLGREHVKKKKAISFDWDQLVIHQGTKHTIIHSIEELTSQVDSTLYYRGCADCAAIVTSLISVN